VQPSTLSSSSSSSSSLPAAIPLSSSSHRRGLKCTADPCTNIPQPFKTNPCPPGQFLVGYNPPTGTSVPLFTDTIGVFAGKCVDCLPGTYCPPWLPNFAGGYFVITDGSRCVCQPTYVHGSSWAVPWPYVHPGSTSGNTSHAPLLTPSYP
jgi:hypothetical protein